MTGFCFNSLRSFSYSGKKCPATKKKTQSYEFLNGSFKSKVTIFNTEIYSTCSVLIQKSIISREKKKQKKNKRYKIKEGINCVP